MLLIRERVRKPDQGRPHRFAPSARYFLSTLLTSETMSF